MKVHHAVRHGVDFFLLVLILSLGLGGILYFSFDKAAQIAVVIIMAVLYTFWGIYHHHHDHDLTLKVGLEYVFFSLLIALLLILFLLRL